MKVSVMGAGPAGSTAAYYLARAGVEVDLVDRVPFPRDKPCAGGLFNPREYDREFPHLRDLEGMQVHRVEFRCGGKGASQACAGRDSSPASACRDSLPASACWVSEEPLVRTVLRRDLDSFLHRRAVEAGAVFRVGSNPRYDEVIDATGTGPPGRYRRAGICLVNDFPADHDLDRVVVHYGFMGIMGYCWVFPKRGYLNVGVGAYLPRPEVRLVYRRFLGNLEDSGTAVLKNRELLQSRGSPEDRSRRENRNYRAGIIPFAPLSRFHRGNTLVTGDAAGMVNPSTGEGIFFAMLSGKLAAQALMEGRDPSWYDRRCREAFGAWLRPAALGGNRRLLNAVLCRAVGLASRDRAFLHLMAENFFRLERRPPAWPFLRGMLRKS
ncbi:MAG: FAD-dependent monooxygenase [Spirochaetota bacterium]